MLVYNYMAQQGQTKGKQKIMILSIKVNKKTLCLQVSSVVSLNLVKNSHKLGKYKLTFNNIFMKSLNLMLKLLEKC